MVTKSLFALLTCCLVALPTMADEKPAEGKKEVELKGKLVCTKCELQETKACGHALIVTTKKDDTESEVKYYINDGGAKEKYHKLICTEPKPATVKGKLGEEKTKEGESRKVINDAKVEVKK